MRTRTQIPSFYRAYFCHIIIHLTEITMKQGGAVMTGRHTQQQKEYAQKIS